MSEWKFDIIRAMLSLSRKLERVTNREFRKIGTTTSQGKVLMYLHLSAGKHDVYQRNLEEELGIRAPSVTGLLCQLERKGLVERHSVPEDARRKKITITAPGQALLAELLTVRQRLIQHLQGKLTHEELAAFFKTCDAIAKFAGEL